MLDALVAQSQHIIRRGSKSFYLATRLFDADIRDDAVLLYAWCRYCDDLIDGQYLGHGPIGQRPELARAALESLQQKTRAALSAEPVSDPIFLGLQHVVRRHGIPAEYPLDLLAGFAMDVANRRYETLNDTLEYCYHVAGVVGAMMAWIMGVRDRDALRRACDLGIGFQLTNIARDVVADALGNRMYLPHDWLREYGLSREHAAAPENRTRLFALVERVVMTAEPFYESARSGLGYLSFRSAWAVAAARETYRTIGLEVVRRGPQGLTERAVVRREQRAWRVLKGGGTALAALGSARVRTPGPRSADLWAKW